MARCIGIGDRGPDGSRSKNMHRVGWTVGLRVAASGGVLEALSLGDCSGSEPAASVPHAEQPEPESAVRGAHESVERPQETVVDDHGLSVDGLPIDLPARVSPSSADSPSGPEVGERLPEFTLSNQHGEAIDFHADRGGQQAVVVFYRSAVW